MKPKKEKIYFTLDELLFRAERLNQDRPEYLSNRSKEFYSSKEVILYHLKTLYSLMDMIEYPRNKKKLKKRLKRIIHRLESDDDEYEWSEE